MDIRLNKGTTKSGGQKHALDKFYTKPEIAKWCLDKVDLTLYDKIIEPSAGNGSFSNQIKNVIAFDLDPENDNIIKQDWFLYNDIRRDNEKILIVGNPPFGQQNVLATKFINHSANFAHTIAFILPKSFMKESVQNRLNQNLHLQKQYELPKFSFELDGESIHVPCVFQIWQYIEDSKREIVPLPVPNGFVFVKKNQNPDLYIQRVGGKAGSVGFDYLDRSEQSNYFIKVLPGYSKEELLEEIKGLAFAAKENSVGPRSISKKEFLLELKDKSTKFF